MARTKATCPQGEKGITLCMPMPFKRTPNNDSDTKEAAEPQTVYAFRFRAYWFVLAQTEGEETGIAPIPEFDIDTALRALNITPIPFDEINGNIQSFVNGHQIALNHNRERMLLGSLASELGVGWVHEARSSTA
jgi:hypothetical protein